MITFVIPTIARPSLIQTLNSLIAQADPDWLALVVFDYVKPDFELPDDDRITYIFLPRKLGTVHAHGQAGLVRNYGMRRVDSEWIAFLDDDDEVTSDYVAHFKEHLVERPDLDSIIFRMTMQGNLYPPEGWGIEECKVGISFCIRRAFVCDHCIWFGNGDTEDFRYLALMRDSGGKYVISKYMTYIAH